MDKENSQQDAARLLPAVIRPGWRLLGRITGFMDRIFTARLNPIYHLGAIGYFLFWILLGTGIYLYLFYDMSPDRAYGSIQRISEGQKWLGGIMRSLHRYASAAFALTVLIHMTQAFFSDRFRKNRWFAWVTGAAILPFMWFEGATGYVMVWDERGMMAAVAFSQWFDVVPLAVEPFSRNFAPGGTLNSLFFFLLSYLHLLMPCVMIIMLWIHNMRIARPPIMPPRPLAWAIFTWFMVAALINPAVSGAEANISRLIGAVEIDWFYLALFPAAHAWSISVPALWSVVLGAFGFVSVFPWVVRDPKAAPARPPIQLDLSKCTGCELCQKACPFEAVSIVPRADGRPFQWQVEFQSERCASCGLCIPACPFPALSMGEWSLDYFDRRIVELLAGKNKTMVFYCERSKADLSAVAADQRFAFLKIPCVGILGPKTVTTSLENGARGIAVFQCSPLNCHYRVTVSRVDTLRGELGGVPEVAVIDGPLPDPEDVKRRLEAFREGL